MRVRPLPRSITRSLSLALAVSFAGAGLSACGSSKKASDTTVAAVETTAAATETTAAAAETSVAATETTAAAAETTVAAAAETTVAGSTETTAAAAAGTADATTAAMVTQMLKGMNGGKDPSAADISCVSGKTKSEDLAALINGSSSGTPDTKTLLPLMKAIFTCKPEGLADSMSTSFDTMPAGVSASNKTCLANSLLDILGSDDQLLELSLSSSGGIKDLPAADRKLVIDKLTPAVNKCIDPSMRAAVIAELNK